MVKGNKDGKGGWRGVVRGLDLRVPVLYYTRFKGKHICCKRTDVSVCCVFVCLCVCFILVSKDTSSKREFEGLTSKEKGYQEVLYAYLNSRRCMYYKLVPVPPSSSYFVSC